MQILLTTSKVVTGIGGVIGSGWLSYGTFKYFRGDFSWINLFGLQGVIQDVGNKVKEIDAKQFQQDAHGLAEAAHGVAGAVINKINQFDLNSLQGWGSLPSMAQVQQWLFGGRA